MKRILVIGNGVVGNANVKLFRDSNLSYDVDVYDKDQSKSETDLKWVFETQDKFYDMIILALPTPTIENKQNIEALLNVCEQLSKIENVGNTPVVIRSTVLPSVCEQISEGYNLNIVHMPEFITEKNAVEDMKNTKRIIISGNYFARNIVLDMFLPTLGCSPEIFEYDDWKVTELIKYANNYFLACKVALANEMYDMCVNHNVDYGKIQSVVSGDPRIGGSHLKVTKERGFGGMCLKKDMDALLGCHPNSKILNTIIEYNKDIKKEYEVKKNEEQTK